MSVLNRRFKRFFYNGGKKIMRELSDAQWIILAFLKVLKIVFLVILFWSAVFIVVASVYVYL